MPIPEISVEVVRELGSQRKERQPKEDGPAPDDSKLIAGVLGGARRTTGASGGERVDGEGSSHDWKARPGEPTPGP